MLVSCTPSSDSNAVRCAATSASAFSVAPSTRNSAALSRRSIDSFIRWAAITLR
jgi:hypothetical protein